MIAGHGVVDVESSTRCGIGPSSSLQGRSSARTSFSLRVISQPSFGLGSILAGGCDIFRGLHPLVGGRSPVPADVLIGPTTGVLIHALPVGRAGRRAVSSQVRSAQGTVDGLLVHLTAVEVQAVAEMPGEVGLLEAVRSRLADPGALLWRRAWRSI